MVNYNFSTKLFNISTSYVEGDASLIASRDHGRIYIKPQRDDDTPLYSYATGAYNYAPGSGITAAYHNYVADPYAGAGVPNPNLTRGVFATTVSGNLVVVGDGLSVFDSSLNRVASLGNSLAFFTPVAFAFNPAGDKLYALSANKKIVVFDTATWVATNVYPSLTASQVRDDIGGWPSPYGDFLQVSSDGKYLAVLAYSETQLIDLTKLLPEGGTPGNDVLSGDLVYGLDGDDTLTGSSLTGAGSYGFLYGGRGNDSYYISTLTTIIGEAANQGVEQVYSSVAFALPENVENLALTGALAINGYGNNASNVMIGNDAANLIDGNGEGQDTLRGMAGNDTLVGGRGNDIFDGGDGQDIASFARATAAVHIDLMTVAATHFVINAGSGQDQLISIEGVEGSGFADLLLGTTGADVLKGGDGDDTLDGRGGGDSLSGGGGNDVYAVSSQSDIVIENDNGGVDTIFTKTNYILASGSAVEVLSTDRNDLANNLNLTGNSGRQQLIGDFGMNVLTGGGGADTLVGLRGNDTYVVDVASYFPGADVVIVEAAGEGIDTVVVSQASGAASWTLTAGSEVELLQAASGTAAINITGNAIAQRIEGNGGANILNGGGGADTLIGFAGDDSYLVRELGSVVVEGNGGGRDTVFTTVSYNLGVNEVEVLSTVSNADTVAIDLIGNFATQLVIGNYGANVLNGGSAGADTLIGLRGNDVYAVGSQSIGIVEAAGEGDDTLVSSASYQIRNGVSIEVFAAQNRGGSEALVLTGNEVAQTVLGNAGANTLDGRGGADTLVGDGGADVFAFTTALGGGNVDTILDFGNGADRIGLATDVFATLVDGGVTAGELVIGTVPVDSDDRLIYDQASGRLFYDADGSGAGGAVQFAQLAAGTTLTAASFVIVAPVGDLPAT